MKKFSDQARDTETSTGKLDDAFNALSPSTLAAVAGVTALVGALKGLTDGFKTAIANYSHFEKLQMGLTTFFQDADKGADKFEELRKLSMETTFGVDELTQSFTEMANVGVDVDTINDKMIMLGNVAQGDKEKFASLVSIYSKISSTGKASAMQMQQLALRGIPIYKVLKEIGVQGTATADDITKAFEKMTEEGGQFHNAMQNINETIEGKEGFISDYFKEFTVNFAEVTGLADAYKKALDVIKEAIGAISDKLLEWNDNPMAKALLSGALVGVITLIGSVIATAIIPRLALVIKSLITMNLLQGPKGWAVLAVAGVGMAVTAYASYCKSAEEATEETKKLADAADKMKDSLKIDEYKRAAGVMPTSASRQSRYESQKNFVAGLELGLPEKETDAPTEKELAEMQSNADTLGYAVELVEGYEELTKRVKELREEEAKRDAGKMEYINGERAKLTALEKKLKTITNCTSCRTSTTNLVSVCSEFQKRNRNFQTLKSSYRRFSITRINS